MKGVGSMNNLRGKKVEKIVAKRYNGVLVSHDHIGCDVELGNSLLEVKSRLSDGFVRYYYSVRLGHIFGDNS